MGNRGPKVTTKTIEDILENCERVGDCCIWKGATHTQGYGMMRQKGVMRSVHSVVAELKYGRKPTKYGGERVSRTCDNNLCANPEHIVIVPAHTLLRGKRIVRGKFKDDDIREIRRRFDNEYYHGIVTEMAKQYNVTVSLISGICSRRIYKRIV